MSNQPKYTIKSLNWEEQPFQKWKAPLPFGMNAIVFCDRQGWFWRTEIALFKGNLYGPFAEPEQAMEDANERCAKVISNCLTTEPAPALQATQYLLARGSIIDWPILAEYSIGSGVWFVSHFEMGTMNNKTGEWSTSEPVDSLDYAFRTAGEAAECFYRFNPHLKPTGVQ